eukprot:2597072-Pyramimonas_sp.AAC.1
MALLCAWRKASTILAGTNRVLAHCRCHHSFLTSMISKGVVITFCAAAISLMATAWRLVKTHGLPGEVEDIERIHGSKPVRAAVAEKRCALGALFSTV